MIEDYKEYQEYIEDDDFKQKVLVTNITFYVLNSFLILISMWFYSGFSFVWDINSMYPDLQFQTFFGLSTGIQLIVNLVFYINCRIEKIIGINIKKYVLIAVLMLVISMILFAPVCFGGYNDFFYSYKEYKTWK